MQSQGITLKVLNTSSSIYTTKPQTMCKLKNLSYLTLIPKKDVPKTSIFDKNFDTPAFNNTGWNLKPEVIGLKVDVQAIYGHRRKRSEYGNLRN